MIPLSSRANPGAYPAALVLVAGWLAAMIFARLEGRVGTVLGVYASAAGLVLIALSWRHLAALLVPTVEDILVGVGLGGILVFGTYLVYPLLARWMPLVRIDVQTLYRDTQVMAGGVPLLVVTVLVEELLWRGVLLDAFHARLPRSLALALSTFLYAMAQLGSGSWVVAILALGLGGLWGLQRLFTHSLVSPILAHLIWTLTVVVIHPLETAAG